MAEINKHHNFDYDTTYPEAIGDNYYAQDLLRDFNYNRHKSGLVIKNLFSDFPILLDNSNITNGSSYHEIDIPISKGYCYFSVEIPNDISSRPGTKMNADIITYVESVALVDFDIQSSATLDGATVNYIKLKYKNTDGTSRTRQHGSGSYVYEKLDSYEIIANDTAPTDYDVVLGTCVGDDSTFLTITNYSKTSFSSFGDFFNTANAAENITAKDPVFQNNEGYCQSVVDQSNVITPNSYSGGSNLDFNHANLGGGYFAHAILKYPANTELYIVVEHYDFSTNTLTKIQELLIDNNMSAWSNSEMSVCAIGNNRIAMVYNSSTAIVTAKVVQFTLPSTLAVLATASVETPTTSSNWAHVCSTNTDDAFAVFYDDGGGNKICRTRVGTYAASVITWVPGAPVVVESLGAGSWLDGHCITMENDHYACIYTDGVNDNRIKICEFTGASVNVATSALQWADSAINGPANTARGCFLGNGTIYLAFQDGAGNQLLCSSIRFDGISTIKIMMLNESFDYWNGTVVGPMATSGRVKSSYLGDGLVFIGLEGIISYSKFTYLIVKFEGRSFSIVAEQKTRDASTQNLAVACSVLERGFIICSCYDTDDEVWIEKFPLYDGISSQTKSAGSNVSVQLKGVVSGLSNLIAGELYNVDVYKGTISQSSKTDNNKYEIGKSASTTSIVLK